MVPSRRVVVLCLGKVDASALVANVDTGLRGQDEALRVRHPSTGLATRRSTSQSSTRPSTATQQRDGRLRRWCARLSSVRSACSSSEKKFEVARTERPTQAMYAAIGRTAAESARVEQNLRELFALLIESPYGRVLTAGEDISRLQQMCLRAARYNKKITEAQLEQLIAIDKAISAARPQRNFLVHSVCRMKSPVSTTASGAVDRPPPGTVQRRLSTPSGHSMMRRKSRTTTRRSRGSWSGS